MATLNLCQFMGNIGKKETRYLPDGKAVCNISLAVNDSYKDKQGNKVEQTEWVKVSMFGKLAEIAEQYTQVGSSIYIAGKMKTRKWEKDGVTHYSTEIMADTMQMLGSKAGEPRATNSVTSPQEPGANSAADFEDDIPF